MCFWRTELSFPTCTQLTIDTIPPPPPTAAGHLNKKNDEPFYSIEMQQEDPFFYEHSKDDHSSSKPWSKRLELDNNLQNPFEPLDHRNTLTQEPYELNETEKVIQELEDDEERQLEAEERRLNSSSNTSTTTVGGYDENKESEKTPRETDSDREFDWDDDPDQVKPKRRKTTKERLAAAMQRPCCWSYLSPIIKRIIIAVCGSCVFIVVAIAIYLTLPKPTEEQLKDPNFTNIRSNVQCWMYWAAFMWHVYWVSTLFLDLVPSVVSLWTKFFHGRRSEKVKSYMEVL